MTFPAIEALKERIVQARAAGNGLDTRNAHLDLFAAYGDVCGQLLTAREYPVEEEILRDWAAVLDRAQTELDEKQLLFGHSRQQQVSGYMWESRGLAGYFLDGDFVNTPPLLQKAEACHERAAELISKVRFPAEAPPAAFEMQKNMVAMQQAEQKRVRGMRLLIQGDYEAEAGDLPRAVQLLGEAVKTLEDGQSAAGQEVPGQNAAAAVLEKGQRDLHFVDFADALLCNARSEQALLAGDLLTAAAEQRERAAALERCQAMHAKAGTVLNDGFVRRLARDIHLAHRRELLYQAEAERKPKGEWIKAAVFFVMAIGSAALFLWFITSSELKSNTIIIGLLLCFIMAIAGIGSRLVKWTEAAQWFRGSLKEVKGKGGH